MKAMIAVFVLLQLSVVALASEPVLVGKVTRVLDGDTIDVQLASGPIRVRFDSIDAPEKKMAGGPEAQAYLSALLLNNQVSLDVREQDRYSRLVAVVFLNDQNVNRSLVESGHAWAYRQYMRQETRSLCELEDDARQKRVGLWAHTVRIYPSDWRRASRQRAVAVASASRESLHGCVAAIGKRE
jgi:endonuclease YncB( thermonuclease family)